MDLTARLATLDARWGRHVPAVMGILNCTPDSFSDGGLFFSRRAAVEHARRMVEGGADIIDVGGESTRPGAQPVPPQEEIRRVVPVLRELRERFPALLLSVDTSKAVVAAKALEVGTDIVNDVTAARDPGMLPVVARAGAIIILMHMRGTPGTMQRETSYTDVVAEVHAFLRDRAQAAAAAGIDAAHIWLDPGIGFGKDDAGNLALLASLVDLGAIGYPVVVGPSRKSFIGRLTGAAPNDRLAGTLAALHPALRVPRAVVRVHEPHAARQYLEIAAAIAGAGR
ncbi:MAG: dihydropteroate synthase [Acidobacteria bacterium]|nr:dihydropteroate synthase [Acidobacteriota bacterium]